MIDPQVKASLEQLLELINCQIDILILKRDNAAPQDKYTYRYTARKLETALGEIHKALDKIDKNNLEKLN